MTPTNKKIVHVTSVHPIQDNRIFHKECRSLAKAGYDVSLVGPNDRKTVIDGIKVIPLAREKGRFRRVLSMGRKAVDLALAEKADLYHLHDPELLMWASRLKRSGAVVVYDMHEDLPLQVRGKVWLPRVLRPLVSRMVKIYERVYTRNIPVVMAEKSYSGSRPWIRPWVEVLNFPRLDWLVRLRGENADAEEDSVGYIGAVTKGRGSIRMLEVMGRLKAAGHYVGFECIGGVQPAHRAHLMTLAAELGLDKVNLPGFMPPEEGWAKIARCRVGLAVLEPLPNYLESYPTKMFEYMAMGLPVVVSDFPLYAEIVERFRCGLAVDPLDTEAVFGAVEELLDHPARAREMGERGQQAALARFNWDSQEENLLGFYRDLLA